MSDPNQSANLTPTESQHLRDLATAAAEHSYSPYSKFRVGAAAKLSNAASMPCGACRQPLAEFGDDTTLILYPGEHNTAEQTTLGALLPHAFRPGFIQ